MSWVTSFFITGNLARARSWRSKRNDAGVNRPAVRQPSRAGRALQGHAARRRGAHEGAWFMAEGAAPAQRGRGVPRVHEGAAEAAEARLVTPEPREQPFVFALGA